MMDVTQPGSRCPSWSKGIAGRGEDRSLQQLVSTASASLKCKKTGHPSWGAARPGADQGYGAVAPLIRPGSQRAWPFGYTVALAFDGMCRLGLRYADGGGQVRAAFPCLGFDV